MTVVTALLGAAVVGLVLALVLARHQRVAAQRIVEDLTRQLAEQRDGAVKAAVDMVVSMAQQTLGAHTDAGVRELESRKQAIGERLEGMNRELDKVVSLVQQLERGRERSYGELARELERTGQTTTELTRATQTLREALASSRTRGQWGERMAEDVLRTAGFAEGVNYRKQETIEGGRPDFTFLLPGGRCVHMDVKFPLDNYLRHLEATGEEERDRALRHFLRDARNRIKELADRDYVDPSQGTLDYMLLFIPNEHLYGFLHEHDDGVVDLALGSKVILCSPLTLFAVLAVIRQAVDNFALARTSDEILERLAAFTKQWDKYCGAVEKVGRGIETTRRAYDDLNGVRRRQLERELDRIDDLRRDRRPADADGTAPTALQAVHAGEGGAAAEARAS